MEEVPLKIRTNALVGAFLETLGEQPDGVLAGGEPGSATAGVAVRRSYGGLNLGTASVSRNVEQIIETMDSYKTEEGNLAYMQRQIAREKARAEAYVAKRKEESAARVQQGLAPLPEEDVGRLFKIPAEPSRLESLLLLGRMEAYGRSLAETTSAGLVKQFGARVG